MKQIKVKPTPGREVPDPQRMDTIPSDGRVVEHSQYWARRIADGDVVIDKASTARKAVGKGEV